MFNPMWWAVVASAVFVAGIILLVVAHILSRINPDEPERAGPEPDRSPWPPPGMELPPEPERNESCDVVPPWEQVDSDKDPISDPSPI